MTRYSSYMLTFLLVMVAAPLSAITITTQPAEPQEFANRDPNIGDTTILSTHITLKHSGPPVRLMSMTLRWQPPTKCQHLPKNFTPTLYHKKHNTPFAPLDDALVKNGLGQVVEDTKGIVVQFSDLDYKVISQHQFNLVINCNPQTAALLASGTFVYSDEDPLETANI